MRLGILIVHILTFSFNLIINYDICAAPSYFLNRDGSSLQGMFTLIYTLDLSHRLQQKTAPTKVTMLPLRKKTQGRRRKCRSYAGFRTLAFQNAGPTQGGCRANAGPMQELCRTDAGDMQG